MIRSLGCLLNYVSSLQSHELLDGDSFQLRIHSFHILQLENYLYIDRVDTRLSLSQSQHSLHSLDIYSMVPHPSLIKGMGREKQGFTMFNLLDRTKTALGRQLLKQ